MNEEKENLKSIENDVKDSSLEQLATLKTSIDDLESITNSNLELCKEIIKAKKGN